MTLTIKKNNFGEEHRHVAASYNNLGSVYKAFGQYNKANEYHEVGTDHHGNDFQRSASWRPKKL